MKTTKLYTIIGFVVFLSLSTTTQANELYQKGAFSISLPDGWVEIPKEIIGAFEKEMAKLAPNTAAQHFVDYGFQLGSAENLLEYPYIFTKIQNIGRIPESQIEKIEGYSAQELVNKYRKDLSQVMSEIQIGKMYYDMNTKIIWLRIESNVVEIGPISGLSGMIPTEKGFIQVSGYSLKGDYSTYEPLFRDSIISVTPSNELVYKPKWSDSLPASGY